MRFLRTINFLDSTLKLVRPEGLEPPAYWFEASRSIQLSYGRLVSHYSTFSIVSQ